MSPCSRYHSYPNRLVNSKNPHICLQLILYASNVQAAYPTSDGRSLKFQPVSEDAHHAGHGNAGWQECCYNRLPKSADVGSRL